MKNLFKRFVREEEGQDMIEYALVAAVITIGTFLIIQNIGTGVSGLWTNIQATVNAAQ